MFDHLLIPMLASESRSFLFAETGAKARGLATALIGGAILLVGGVLLAFSKSRPSLTRGILGDRQPQGKVYFIVRWVVGPLFLIVAGLALMLVGLPKAL